MKLATLLQFTGLLLIASFSAYVRIHGLTSNGIIGSDVYQYWDIALMWQNGQYVLNNDLNESWQYFRPVFYALNLLSINLFGIHDYSLRMLIGGFETINIVLVCCIGTLFFRDRFLGILLTIVYATIPSSILQSLTELPHAYSTTFLLLMYLSYLLAYEKLEDSEKIPRMGWVGLSGMSAGLAATCHGSLTFLGPVGILLFGSERLLAVGLTWSLKIKHIFICSAIFTVSFFIPYLLFGALVGYEYMIRALLSETRHNTGSDMGHLALFWNYLFTGPKETISLFSAYCFLISIAVLVFTFLLGGFRNIRTYSSAMIILGFCVLFSLVFKNVFYERIFVPFNIFVVVTIFCGLHILLHRKKIQYLYFAFALLSLMISYSAFVPKRHIIESHFHGQEKGYPRAVFDVIGSMVSDNARLLIAPYIQYYHRPQFKAAVYFKDNALYLMDCKEGSLKDFIEREKIRFIFISTDLDRGIITSNQARYQNLGVCTGMTKESYAVDFDVDKVREFLVSVGAKKLPIIERYGELYSF